MSKYDIEKMIALYESGKSTTQVAKEIGCSVATVAFHLNKRANGLRPKKVIDWPVDKMRQWYEVERKTVEEIGVLLGISSKVVNKACKRFGFAMRPRGQKFGSEHKGWKGGRTIDKAGYVLVYMPEHPDSNSNGYIREHRLVMEKKLGRRLEKHEVVHHIDENTSNNDPDNLELFASNGDHLAETRAGRCPNWTPEGREVLAKTVKDIAARRASRRQSKPDDSPSP